MNNTKMNDMNNMIHEIGILETVLGMNTLSTARIMVYTKKRNALKSMLRLSIQAIRRN